MEGKPIIEKPNKNDPDSIYNWIVQKISCKEFSKPIRYYCLSYCKTFKSLDEENSIKQGIIFKKLNNLLENLLIKILREGNITKDEFVQAAERGLKDPKNKHLFNQIISLQNYNFFKIMMIKENDRQNKYKMYHKEIFKPKQNEKNIVDEITPELVNIILESNNQEPSQLESSRESIEKEVRRRLSIIEEEERRRALKKREEEIKKEPDNQKFVNFDFFDEKDEKGVVQDEKIDIMNFFNPRPDKVQKPYIPNPFKRDNQPKEEKESKKDIIEKSIKESIIQYEDMMQLFNGDD